MAARAIHAMQLQLIDKCRPRHEALQFRHPHVRHVLEHHVLADCFHRRVNLGAGKSQALHERLRHLRADAIVPIEANAAVFIDQRSRRLPDVVK